MDDKKACEFWEFWIFSGEDDAGNWETLKAVRDVCKKYPGDKIPWLMIKDRLDNHTVLTVICDDTPVDGTDALFQEAYDCPVYPLRINSMTRTAYLAEMPYREYLQTPEWKETAKRKRQQAGKRCQVCNASGVQLDVHHRTYENRGHELDEDLIVLCHECHGIFERAGKIKQGD